MAWVPSKANRMDWALAVAASTSIDRIKAFFIGWTVGEASWTIRWKRCGVEVRISRTRYSKADQSDAKSGPRSLRSNLWMAWVPSKANRMDCALAVAASTSID